MGRKMHEEHCKSIWLVKVFKDHADCKYLLFSKAELYSHEEEGKAQVLGKGKLAYDMKWGGGCP